MYNQIYLTELINDGIEESLSLEYKGPGALERTDNKTKEISKDVSAFANSAGGLLIYGILEDNVNKHLPSKIDPVDRRKISKEWLEQIIQSSIQPRIDGIKIVPIEIDGDINKVVYIVEIPKSSTAHQANDKRYYRRFNFNSVPMENYEIRDVFNRTKDPIVEVEFEIDSPHEIYPSVQLSIHVKNTGTVLANYINCVITVPSDCLDYPNEDFHTETVEFYRENTVTNIIGYTSDTIAKPIYGSIRYKPLLPKRRMKLMSDAIKLTRTYLNYSVRWAIYADNAEPIEGNISLRNIDVSYC